MTSKKIAGLVLKLILALGLGFWVIQHVETSDILSHDIHGEAEDIHGQLIGEFSTGQWEFKPARTPGQAEILLQPKDFSQGVQIRPGFFTLLRHMDGNWFALGVGLWAVLLFFAAYRWLILLRAAGIQTKFSNSLRLCFIGYFFNNVMPGVTGGDLVRGALVTRGLERNRWRAALSVIVDRLIGLLALLTLAALVLGFALWGRQNQEATHLAAIGKGVFLLLGTGGLLGSLYLSRRVRSAMGFERWLPKLPGSTTLAKIHEALTVYRNQPLHILWAFLMSIPLQFCGVFSFWAIGQSVQASLSPMDTFVIFPVVQTLSAVPIAPAGWGIGESLYGTFFKWFGSSFTMGVAVSVLFRVTTQIGFGLVGGIVWMFSDRYKKHVHLIKEKG